MTRASTDRELIPLFVNEKECAERLGVAVSSWPIVRRRWEARGFPKMNAETKKYLWPQVKDWVFRDNSFRANLSGHPDGAEDWS